MSPQTAPILHIYMKILILVHTCLLSVALGKWIFVFVVHNFATSFLHRTVRTS